MRVHYGGAVERLDKTADWKSIVDDKMVETKAQNRLEINPLNTYKFLATF